MARIRVRARAVDMLGRQQIFGIPAAIHELFKNAHDAYASRVEVDYFRGDRILVLRDDGIGMTRSEFESRWLTLGTEAKVGANEDDAVPWLASKCGGRRTIMGEKGIGRLAVAAIGPQVLVLTRAIRDGGRLHNLVMSLVHWGVFELPGLDLDQIEIPVREVPGGRLPTKHEVKQLSRDVQKNIRDLGSVIDKKSRDRLLAELDAFDIDPVDASGILGCPKLSDSGHGTHFFVSPTHTYLEDDVNDVDADDVAAPLQKMLLGFTNTMMPDRPTLPICALFRDRRADGTVVELIGGESFFTPEEFAAADHHFEGVFDQFGQFSGTVSVYGRSPFAHQITWRGAQNRQTDCGPFKIKIAYVQGKPSESNLPPDAWARISGKLNKIGGLYIYRDGIRILPYGNSDVDFLNIERRRTKSAQDWFFSYRRIFGAVEITHAANPDLVEKAGREGFRANTAYRQFTAILENFFQSLAIDFFRESGRYSDDYIASKNEFEEREKLLKKREKSAKDKKQRFAVHLDRFFESVEKGAPQAHALRVREEVVEKLRAIEKAKDRDQAAAELLRLEAQVRHQVAELRENLRVARPSGIGLTKAMASDWQAYKRNQSKIDAEIISPLDQELDTLISKAAESGRINLDRRRRIDLALEECSRSANVGALELRKECIQQLDGLSGLVREDLRAAITGMDGDIRSVVADFERSELGAFDNSQAARLRHDLEARVKAAGQRAAERLKRIRDQLGSVVEALRAGTSTDDITAAVEEKSEAYREELDIYLEWAQIGMAIGIVQHEFTSAVNVIRTNIQQLKPWADGTPDLRRLYKSLHVEFEHLEAYLMLFTPLRRRLYRKRVSLSGEEIRKYICEVFGARLERHNVKLKATTRFDRRCVNVFPSTFLPCFLNLVDNAIYWLSTSPESAKEIKFDADDRGFTIENTGPGIERRIAERIFEFGVTSKPNGRGMGLSISRESLRREGYDLTLENPGRDNCPRFRIELSSASDVDGRRS